MSQFIKEAIVVGFVNYGESDKIIRVITPEFGLISAFAKKVRNANHRWAGVLDVGNQVQLTLEEPKNELWQVTDAQNIVSRMNIRQNIHKLATMMYCAEVIYALSIPEDPQPKLFGLLQNTLDLLNSGETPTPSFHIGFTVKALALYGMKPSFTTCAICAQNLDSYAHFHPILGGMVHKKCIDDDNLLRFLYAPPSNWHSQINALLHIPLKESAHITVPQNKEGQRSSLWLLTEMLEHVVEKKIQSADFLKTVYTT